MSSSYKAVIQEIDSYLKNEELAVNSDQDRLFHLWTLFQHTLNNLKSALENIDVLRSQFNDETNDFEGYVEHITKLSDEREARASECEAENEDLKEQVQRLRQQLASFDNSETRDMLLQAGLDDIVHVRPSAQIAYLLVERARFMDIMEEMQNKTMADERSTHFGGFKLPFGGNSGDEFSEMSWTKLKDLLDKVDDLESTNEHLMHRMKELAPDEYQQLIVSQTQRAAATGSVNQTPTKPKMSDFVPKKPFVPPKDLQEAIVRLKAAEEKEAEMEVLRLALNEKMLEHTFNDEDSSASLLFSPRGGLGTRELERHNSEIQNRMSAVDGHLKQLISPGTLTVGEVANKLQQEFERVKVELEKMMEKYRVQYRKYADHKLDVKNRMHALKEGFRQERLKLTEEIEQLQNDLGLVKVTLQKEMEYKDNMEKSHHTLLVEQQDLQIKLSEQEDLVQVKCRELAKLKVETECLEDENNQLRLRLDNSSKQKNMFRIITP